MPCYFSSIVLDLAIKECKLTLTIAMMEIGFFLSTKFSKFQISYSFQMKKVYSIL